MPDQAIVEKLVAIVARALSRPLSDRSCPQCGAAEDQPHRPRCFFLTGHPEDLRDDVGR